LSEKAVTRVSEIFMEKITPMLEEIRLVCGKVLGGEKQYE
jgi:hypothetical protein